MASLADIFNRALRRVGADARVQNPDTDTDKGAAACRTEWPGVRDEVLRGFNWPRLKSVATLTLLETAPNNGVEWAFLYSLPPRFLRARRVLNGSDRFDTSSAFVPYELGRHPTSGAEVLYCDLEDAQLEFTYAETEAGRFDPDVVFAMVSLLASRLGPGFGPEGAKRGQDALKEYVWALTTAKTNALNEIRRDIPQDSDLERSRG